MKKTFYTIILLFIFISSLNAYSIKVKTNKYRYLRYELVNITVSLHGIKNGKTLLGNGKAELEKAKKDSVCKVKIFHRKRTVETVGETKEIILKYDPETSNWHGMWPIPWNPRLGKYYVFAYMKFKKKRYASNRPIEITGRKVPPLEPGFCAMDIEPGNSIIKRVPGVGGRSVKIWENYILWAKFMGASALWHNVGQSQIWNKLDSNVFPWVKQSIRQVPELSKACHKYDMKYGAWITSFICLGNRLDLSPYRQTTGYDRYTGDLKQLIYISIYDQKRQQDIIDLLKKMDANPNVDYLGFDYMRTDFGGYEYVDRFVSEMPVPGVPGHWDELDEEDKRLWLAQEIEVLKNKQILDMWRWWRAHMMSIIITEIIKKSGIKKPIWLFSLTWNQGKEHGQDPLMFRDAGININAGMFYSIDKDTYPHMLEDWREYLSHGNTNLLIGQCVDWNLLGRTHEPPGPEEHYDRQKMAIKKFIRVNPTIGLFWHDLTRAFKSSRGPYSALEWAIAGGASFSYLRERQGLFPFDISWEAPDKVWKDEVFTVEINIKNKEQITKQYYLKLLKISGLEVYGDIVQNFYLAPGEIKTITYQIKAIKKVRRKMNKQMIAFMLQYGQRKTQERFMDFKYITVK